MKDKIKQLQGPIFIFGASGFIGANLFEQIFAVRQDVYAITHDSTVAWRLKMLDIPHQNILHCDILSKGNTFELFNEYDPKTVFNLAAYGAYSKQSNINLTYETNVIGTLNILEASKNAKFILNTGSSSEYGYNCEAPDENDQLEPNSHYSVSKISAAYLIKYYAKQFSTPCINVRLYSIYGSWEEPDRLIPKLIEQGRNKLYPPFVNPNISRDFVYIDDCLEAFFDLALKITPENFGKSFNLATGIKTTIGDLANASKQIFNIQDDPQWGTMENRKWDLQDWYGNANFLTKVTGWKPKIGIIEGLKKTNDWFEKMDYCNAILPAFSNPKTNPKITCVIACYKDAQAIPYMYDRLIKVFKEIKTRYEIIFINDNSPDNSEEVIRQICLKDNNVIGINHSRNFGSQSGFLSGMEISTGNCVVLMDGDLQDPPEIIPQFYHKWLEGNDVVYGVRVKREMSVFMEFFYKTFYKIFSSLSFINIPQNAGDFSMMDKKVVDELVKLPETEQFLRGLRAFVGFKQTGVEYVRPERMFGVSTNNWRKNFAWARKAIFSFSFVPLELLSIMGLVLTLISFVGLITQVILKFTMPDAPQGFSTIIVLVLFFGGIQLLAVSVLGEYIAKIFEETKKRPKFIRRSVIHSNKVYAGEEKIKDFRNK